MAAALLRHRLAALGLDDQVRVESAGVWSRGGSPASADALAVLGERGISLREHRSQPVTPALLEEADVVLVMEEAHRRSIFHLAPQHLGKVLLFSELAGGSDEIEDPYGGPIEEYIRTAARLEALIDAGLPRLLGLLGVSAPPESPR